MAYEEIQALASERQPIAEKLKYIKTEKTREELLKRYSELTEKIVELMTKNT